MSRDCRVCVTTKDVMRFFFVMLLCSLGTAASGQQYLNAVPADNPSGYSSLPPVDPSQMTWVRKGQWGAGHTIVVPQYQWSQYGSGDSLIVPNDQMWRYPLGIRPRPYTFTVPLVSPVSPLAR
jgi:hypothetical protein